MTEEPRITLARLNLPAMLTGRFRVYAVGQLSRRSDQATAEGDDAAREVCDVLANMAILNLRPEDAEAPYGLWSEVQGTLGFGEGRLTPAAAALLQAVREHVMHPALQARAADVLWVFERDHRAARAAVTHYLDQARACPDEEWLEGVDALERATNLAKSLGKRAEERTVVASALAEHLREGELYGHWGAGRVAVLLHGLNPDATAEFLPALLGAAQAMEERRDWDGAQSTWGAIAEVSEAGAAQTYRVLAAEVDVKQAEEAMGQPSRGALVAGEYLKAAIQDLRSIGGTQARVAELHQRLVGVQALSVDQLRLMSRPLEDAHVEGLRTAAREFIGDGDLRSCLLRLGMFATELSVAELAAQASGALAGSALGSIHTTYVNGAGGTVESSVRSTDDRALERTLEVQRWWQQAHGRVLIEEARRFVLERFVVRRDDLRFLVAGNEIIPDGHRLSVLLGLHAGLMGDFITAAHLLVPQVEAMIRHLAQALGAVTSKLTHQGIQDVEYLNTLLIEERFTSVLAPVLGEDFLFELRGLLVERMGANARNVLAHGLAPDGMVHYVGVLVWHAAWRMVVTPRSWAK